MSTHTLYLAVEVPDQDDFTHLAEQIYDPHSSLTRQLELVLQARFGGVLVNPVRDAVMLKVADAQMAADALSVTIQIHDAAPSALESAHDGEALHRAHDAISGCLEVIRRGGVVD